MRVCSTVFVKTVCLLVVLMCLIELPTIKADEEEEMMPDKKEIPLIKQLIIKKSKVKFLLLDLFYSLTPIKIQLATRGKWHKPDLQVRPPLINSDGMRALKVVQAQMAMQKMMAAKPKTKNKWEQMMEALE